MSSPRKALVLGANGQDGSYLCEILCARGHDVVAVGRQPQPRWPVKDAHYRYQMCDVADLDALSALLRETAPDIVFHFAAIHGPAGFDYEAVWRQAHFVNTLSVHAVLDYIRAHNPGCGLVYASSSKVFGTPMPPLVDEDSPRLSTCIYSTTKNAAQGLIEHYRARHGVAASVLYLFNHESPRREAGFFIPRVAAALVTARAGTGQKTRLHTLDFTADWGDAREYMDIAADIGERGLGEDYVLATGTSWNARKMVADFFRRHGLDVGDHIETTMSGVAAPARRVSIARLRERLGRVPRRSVLDVLDDMAGTAP
jgi:GDPmannose 4,6-dehydratase